MIPYGRQDISQADIDAVVEVLKADFLTQGPAVGRFEACVAEHVGARFSIATNSATGALHIACLALGVGQGDWLWTSPTTFVASSNAALYCGAQVDFVDIDPRTYNMSPTRLEEKLVEAEKLGRLPKVVMPVHLCGQPCDMPAIKALADRFGFRIIEDASHAVGARYRSGAEDEFTPVGDCRFSDIAVFSFHPVKIVTTGEGGMALTNDPDLADRLQRFRSHGITNNPAQMQPTPEGEIWNYQQVRLGYNYRLTDIQAALGISQMARLDDIVRRRHAIAERYDRDLAGLSITLPWQDPNTYSSYHLYPILVDRTEGAVTQRQAYDAMQSSGINVNLHYIPVYRQPYYQQMGFQRGYCPTSEDYFTRALSIPMYPTLTDDEQGYVIDVIKRLVG